MKEKNLIALLILTVFVLVVLWVSYLFLANKDQGGQIPTDAIAKAGEENIFQADLDRLESMTSSLTADKTQLLNQLVDESLLLQLGSKEGWLTLESSFFNSSIKDYSIRQQKLSEVIASFNDAKTSGNWTNTLILHYWFGEETEYIKTNGIDAAAKLAENTLKTFIDQVKQGTTAFDQGAITLNNNTDYSQKLNPDYGRLSSYFEENDTIYRPNAVFTVRKYPLNPDSVSELIFNIKESQSVLDYFNSAQEKKISPLYKIEDKVDDRVTNGFYVVFQIKEKRIGYKLNEVAQWLENNKSDYTVTFY